MTRILGIETSSADGSVALLADDRCLASRKLKDLRRRHAQTLVPELKSLLDEHRLRPQDIDLVTVSLGPGSFTALRVGVVCAKTMAYATGGAVVGVDTFLAIAERAPENVRELFVVADALRGEVFAGRYRRREDGHWEPREEIRIVDAASWCAERKPGERVSGPGVERIAPLLPDSVVLLPEGLRHSAAEAVARVGLRLFREQGAADPLALEPFYLRPSAAEEKQRQAKT